MLSDALTIRDDGVINFVNLFDSYRVVYLEESAKNGIRNRVLVKIPQRSITSEEVKDLAISLGFPYRYLNSINDLHTWSTFVMFAFDSGEQQYKLYFERPIDQSLGLDKKHMSIYSIKWKGAKVLVTDYYYVMTKSMDWTTDQPIPEYIIEYLKCQEIKHYYIAQDRNSKRESICILVEDQPIRYYQYGTDSRGDSFGTEYYSIFRNK
jgi:hypothetical protein